MIAGAVLLLALAGCGGGGAQSDSADKRPSTPEPSSTPSASPKATMFQTCANVDIAIQKIGGWPMVPKPEEADQLMVAFHDLAEAGDEESQTALTLLRDPIDAVVLQYPTQGKEMIKAAGDLNSALLAFMDRCLAVGSTALE
jgi:hypothetical protein